MSDADTKFNESPQEKQNELTSPLLFDKDISPIQESQLFAETLLAISSIKGVGKKTIGDLFDLFKGRIWQIWGISPIELAFKTSDIPRADKLVDALKGNQNHILEIGQTKFEKLKREGRAILSHTQLPESLQKIPDAPKWLFVEGNYDLLFSKPIIAVVGTRKPSGRGRRATEIVAEMVAPYSATIVSGLADGIDKKAHEETMSKGLKNIAFLGHGIDVVFPADTTDTRQRIIENGGLVATEYPLGEPYHKQNFVQRNRLQAALANLVIPVEANIASGTAHTVRFARKFGTQIIGIGWEGAEGIVQDIAENNEKIIRVDSKESLREFDSILKNLAKKAKKDDYPLHSLEKIIESELSRRDISPKDLTRLRKFIKEVVKRRGS
jgi:DNA processing protein